MGGFSGKTAVVTGASSGIGRAVALRLGEAGAGGTATAVAAELRDPGAVQGLVDRDDTIRVVSVIPGPTATNLARHHPDLLPGVAASHGEEIGPSGAVRDHSAHRAEASPRSPSSPLGGCPVSG